MESTAQTTWLFIYDSKFSTWFSKGRTLTIGNVLEKCSAMLYRIRLSLCEFWYIVGFCHNFWDFVVVKVITLGIENMIKVLPQHTKIHKRDWYFYVIRLLFLSPFYILSPIVLLYFISASQTSDDCFSIFISSFLHCIW